jgi:pilus assembly protein CpaB
VTGRNFANGDLLRFSDLRDAAVVGIAARVPDGERAFSIRVSEDEIVGGFLQSGDHVDIFATIPGSVFPASSAQGTPDRSQAVLLLQNVHVLAVGENSATRGSVQATARTVSLSLPPAQLARLTLALRFGRVSLAIRNPGDNDVAAPAAATLADLIPQRTESAPGHKSSGGIPFYAGAHESIALAGGSQ